MPRKTVRAICFDWGGTLMSEVGPGDIPMALWPEVQVLDGAFETLAALHNTHTLCVATNATMSQRPMVERALARGGLLQFFSDVFTFTDLGVKKESPAFWQAVTSRLQLQPSEVAMVGDSLESDVIAPIRFGMHAIWFNASSAKLAPVMEVPTIARLQDLIELFNAT
jgi:HAD superfamily hydrolase (TIGR01509 family)